MARCGALALGDLGPHQLDAIEVGKVRFPSGGGSIKGSNEGAVDGRM